MERAAVDLVLGPPASAWEGAARGSDGHSARSGHAARSQRHLLLPVLHELHGRVGWISAPALGVRLPPADHPTGRGVRRRELLRPVRPGAPAAQGRSCLHRHRVHVPRRRGARRGARARRSARRARPRRTARRSGSRARASACASRLPPRSSRSQARTQATTRSEPRARRPSWRPWRARCPSRRAGTRRGIGGELRLLRRIGHVDPTSIDSYRNAGGYAALRRALELGPGRRDPRGDRLEAAGARRRRVSDRSQVGGGGAQPGAAALPRLQRRRVGAGHVQGPDRDRERPVRADRGAHDRRLRDRLRSTPTSTFAASTRWRGSGWPTRSRRRTPTACSATT